MVPVLITTKVDVTLQFDDTGSGATITKRLVSLFCVSLWKSPFFGTADGVPVSLVCDSLRFLELAESSSSVPETETRENLFCAENRSSKDCFFPSS